MYELSGGINGRGDPVVLALGDGEKARAKSQLTSRPTAIPSLQNRSIRKRSAVLSGRGFTRRRRDLPGRTTVSGDESHYDGVDRQPSDHMSFTRLFQNSAKIHFDARLTQGKPLVSGAS